MRLSIRTKLALLVLAVLLPLLAAAAFRFWGDMSEGRRVGNQSQLDAANLIGWRLDEILTGQIESLLALASSRSLESVQDADLERLAGRVRERHPFMRRFAAVSADGRVVATSGYRDGESTFLTPDVIASVLSPGEPVVIAHRASPSDGRQIVAMVVPVQDRQGRSVGAFGAELDLETLSRYLNALPLGREQTVAVVSKSGDVLAHSLSPHDFFNRPLGGVPDADALVRRGTGSAEWAAEDGVAHLVGAASMTRAPWIVVAAMPSGAASAPAANRLTRDLVALGAATVLALLVASLIGNRMHRSVRALMRGARNLEDDHAPPISVSTRDELAELADQFNRTVGERRQTHAALDERQRRLRALADINVALSQQLELKPLLGQITQALAQLTGAGTVVFWEVDEARGLLVRRAWTSIPSVALDQMPMSVGIDAGGVGLVARSRRPLFIEDVTPDDRQLLTSFASQAAVAVRNARLFAEATRRRREAEELAQVARMLTESLDIHEVADRVVKSVLPIFGVDAAGLRLMRPDGRLEAIAWAGSALGFFQPGHLLEPGDGLVARAVTEGQAV